MKRLELYLGSAIVLTVTAMAVTSLFWTPFSTTVLGEHPRFLPATHVLGTDSFGSDTFSLLFAGARVVLMVGVIAVGIAAVFGVPLGTPLPRASLGVRVLMRARTSPTPSRRCSWRSRWRAYSGAHRNRHDRYRGRDDPQFVVVTRAGALQVYASDFVLAARACGTGRLAIARQHVLPNIAPLIGVQASVSFAMAILAEAALSYLGLGTQPPTPTWGRMLHEAQAVLIVHPLQAVWPGLAVVLAVLGFNLLGDGLRDLLDPRLREVA